MPSPSISFEGIGSLDGVVPGDPNGAVGPQHYVQTVNMHFAVYTKTTGALLFGPVPINILWSGFGEPCQSHNNGDPIVLYDQFADRWLISEFAIPSVSGPFIQCVAVSVSGDPTGAYYRYQFQMPAVFGYTEGKFNDYSKWAVWNNSYFMTTNEFSNATTSAVPVGDGIWAINRAQMLSGVISPTFVYIDLGQTSVNFQNILPANLDGTQLPPANAPGYFMEVDSTAFGWPDDALRLWQFNIDWTQPNSATFGSSGLPNTVLTVTTFTLLPCVLTNSLSCIPQPGAPAVDAVGDRLMYRLVYRNFGDHEALVVNHTVYTNNVAGIRWYEVRDPSGTPTIYQQGTYAPDSVNRWMGSIAFDHDGNIAVGYSASNSSTYPSIRYAGRLNNDPLGVLAQSENTIITGKGSQTASGSSARWGDYSSISIDPTDDCTFWYTNQYYPVSTASNWHTRIGSFKFPTCGFTVSGAVTDIVSGAPLIAQINVTSSPINPPIPSTVTDASGNYTLTLSGGRPYTMTVTANSRQTQTRAIGILSANDVENYALWRQLLLVIVLRQ